MSTSERSQSLTHLARIGFSRLAEAEAELAELQELLEVDREALTGPASRAADPDAAVSALTRIARRDAASVRALHGDDAGWRALWALLGTSTGFADFYLRHPEELAHLVGAGRTLPTAEELREALLASVGAEDGFAADASDSAWVALRVRYRQMLAAIAAYDLMSASPVDEIAFVAARLADAAGAALEASLCVARTRVSGGGARRRAVPPRSGRRNPPRRDRNGQDRRARAELRE